MCELSCKHKLPPFLSLSPRIPTRSNRWTHRTTLTRPSLSKLSPACLHPLSSHGRDRLRIGSSQARRSTCRACRPRPLRPVPCLSSFSVSSFPCSLNPHLSPSNTLSRSPALRCPGSQRPRQTGTAPCFSPLRRLLLSSPLYRPKPNRRNRSSDSMATLAGELVNVGRDGEGDSDGDRNGPSGDQRARAQWRCGGMPERSLERGRRAERRGIRSGWRHVEKRVGTAVIRRGRPSCCC
ncbi:hypothetical protein IWX50DRAFT_304538 [Phyllosticta citricarpa]|uniref:Uncharacterized protein n=1 Tax=Phyllosticta citricarpa TaxID=55181 RepID=A0ABR1L3F0_9PEZI